MIIKVTEKCWIESQEVDKQTPYDKIGIRTYTYESDGDDLKTAFNNMEDNFDSDKVIRSDDDFEEGCLDSIVIKVELVE
ncbi:hypothetical protein [Clostridium sp.]|uniref:hypothetical protein n=1 Tax=Clostridium sp. TaxID=1506 RepID=UPI00321764B1